MTKRPGGTAPGGSGTAMRTSQGCQHTFDTRSTRARHTQSPSMQTGSSNSERGDGRWLRPGAKAELVANL